jgi:hypothetical protein
MLNSNPQGKSVRICYNCKFIIILTADRTVPYILLGPFELRSRAFGYLATWRINTPLPQT